MMSSLKGTYTIDTHNTETLVAGCAVGISACFASPIGGLAFHLIISKSQHVNLFNYRSSVQHRSDGYIFRGSKLLASIFCSRLFCCRISFTFCLVQGKWDDHSIVCYEFCHRISLRSSGIVHFRSHWVIMANYSKMFLNLFESLNFLFDILYYSVICGFLSSLWVWFFRQYSIFIKTNQFVRKIVQAKYVTLCANRKFIFSLANDIFEQFLGVSFDCGCGYFIHHIPVRFLSRCRSSVHSWSNDAIIFEFYVESGESYRTWSEYCCQLDKRKQQLHPNFDWILHLHCRFHPQSTL